MFTEHGSFERQAQVMKALAHPSRLMMIDALAEGERCVCELQALVGSDLSTVSKHLALLEKAGLVASRKMGLYVYYRLRVPAILRIFSTIETVLAEQEKNFPSSPTIPSPGKRTRTAPRSTPHDPEETAQANGRKKL